MAAWMVCPVTIVTVGVLGVLACGGGSEPPLDVVPARADLAPGGVAAFQAFSGSDVLTDAHWSVAEPGGGDITGAGRYTAPAANGTFHVLASSSPSAKPSAAVVVVGGAPTHAVLGGAGWDGSTSLTTYPKTGQVTGGGPVVRLDDRQGGKTPEQRLHDALARG